MSLDLDATLATIRDRQWALTDFDWEAPGAELITDEQWPKLKAFMSDVVWIEHVGARAFAALVDTAADEDATLAEIYRWFHAEEQRHANAELALMRRWGMVEPGETPEVNTNIRLAIDWLDNHAHDLPLGLLTTVIAMLEVALDGALLRFLLEEVDDPLCHEVFERINNDESRHLAVDFEVMERMGLKPPVRETILFVASLLRPSVLLGLLVYVPLLSRMRDNIVGMGLDEQRLYQAIRRFDQVGSRSPATRRYVAFRFMRGHGRMVVDRSHPYHLFGDGMVWLTRRIPTRVLGALPSWVGELTSEPTR